MGILLDIVNVNSYLIATEADDITAEVSDGLSKISPGSTAVNKEQEDEEADIEKVDDIFGTANTDDDPTNDASEGEEDTSGGDEDSGAGEDAPTDEEGGDESPTEESVPQETGFTNKNSVRDNLVTLLGIVDSNIELIAAALNKSDESVDIQVLNMVNANLRSIKQYIEKMVETGFEKIEYADMIRQYISLRMMYMNCAEIIEKQFKHKKDQ